MDKWYNLAHLSFVVLAWPLKCHTKDIVIKTFWNIMPSEINCKMHFNLKKTVTNFNNPIDNYEQKSRKYF